MPVTARLSRLLYERLGDEIANELVNWFNQVDATYRGDLRELNDLNFARFDAKLEQRVAELHARLDARIDKVQAELNARIDKVQAELNARIDKVHAELNARIDQLEARILARMEQRLAAHVRWLVAAWLSLMVPLLGLWFRL